jgi:hypothetical protein
MGLTVVQVLDTKQSEKLPPFGILHGWRNLLPLYRVASL